MSSKNWIRTVVILGIISWPTIETYRLWSTTQQLHQAQTLERTVTASLAAARVKHAQIAKVETTGSVKP